MTILYTFIHTWEANPCSTSQICPSWSRPWVRLSPSLAHTCLAPSLFVLAHPVTCCLSQRFIFHTYNPPFTTRGLNTFIQVNIMGALYNMYNWHIYNLQLFFCCFCLTSGQSSWPRTFMSWTVLLMLTSKRAKTFLEESTVSVDGICGVNVNRNTCTEAISWVQIIFKKSFILGLFFVLVSTDADALFTAVHPVPQSFSELIFGDGFDDSLTLGKRKKSAGARSGKKSTWGIVLTPLATRNLDRESSVDLVHPPSTETSPGMIIWAFSAWKSPRT